MNNLDAFERRLKESLDQYEVPYNSADWAQMERALSSGVRGWGRGRTLLVGLLLASGLLIGGTAYYMGKDKGADMADTSQTRLQGTVTETPIASVTAAPVPAKDLRAAPAPLPTPAEAGTAKAATKENAAPAPAARTESKAIAHKPTGAGKPPANTPVAAPLTASSEDNVPKPMFRASVKEACPGTPVDFTVKHMPEDGIYLWNFGDGSFSNKPNPQHTYVKPGNYQVMLSMSSVGGGSIHNKPSSGKIVIHEAPSANFNIIHREFEGQLPSVHFDSRSQIGASYHWDLGDGSTSTSPRPDHVYKEKGTYPVVLKVTNATGCVDRQVKKVRIEKDFNLGAPASFSPDGDADGDTFMPEALHKLNAKFQLAVYDTTGTLLYSTSDPSRPWTGKPMNKGAVCPTGDYVWVVDVEGGLQAPETFTGKVKLLR